MRQRTISLTVLLLFALVISACGSPITTADSTPVAESPPSAPPTATTAATATAAPSASPSPEATPTDEPTATPEDEEETATLEDEEETATADEEETATADFAQVLDAKFYQDSDGNIIPDFMETELGADPNVDDCAQQECGGSGEGADYLNKERNTLLILDSSGSMAAQVPGGNKLDVAKEVLADYVSVAAAVTNLGFLVYGHKGNNTDAGKPESCVGIDLLTPIGQLQPDTFRDTLNQFQPTGWTPIAAALTEGGKAFAGKEGENNVNRIILVSDGIETCEGDPVAVAEQLYNEGLAVQIDVLGFDIAEGSADQAQLRRIAEVTGGQYYDAKSAEDLRNYFKQQAEAIVQTWDSLICELRNFSSAGMCDRNLSNRAIREIRELQFAATTRIEEDAYEELADRISAGVEEREQIRTEASNRFSELQQQYAELRSQLSDAFSQ